MNDFFTAPDVGSPFATARIETIEAAFANVEAGFDKLPPQRKLQENRVTYGEATGTASALSLALDQDLDNYQNGLTLRVKTPLANAGPATINVNSMGFVQIFDHSGNALVAGAMSAGGIAELTYIDGAFRLMNDSASAVAAAAAVAQAEASADAAQASETNAAADAVTAAGYSSDAAASAAAAAVSEDNAADSVADAAAWAGEAQDHATAAAAAAGAAFRGTSATSIAVGTGTKGPFTLDNDAAFAPGQSVVISSQADPTKKMAGPITAYDPPTKHLTINATSSNGTGSPSDWIIGLDIGGSVSFADVTGDPTDNSALSTALSGKAATGSITTGGITMATARMLGRSSASTGAVQEISIGAGLQLAAGSLSCTVTGMTYPGAGIAVSTGSGWGTPLAAPAGDILGTTDTQDVTNKSLNAGTKFTVGELQAGVTVNDTGTIGADSPGYRGAPRVTDTARTLGLSDAGKLLHVSGTTTIPANASVAFPVGTVILLSNSGSTNISVAITTDTLRLAGTTTTGTRTLLPYGLATLTKVNSTEWKISGTVS